MNNDLQLPVIGIDRLRMATDGTGVRTLICSAGCTLRCRYCLNPQSWDGSMQPRLYTPQQLYDKVAIDNIYFQATNGGLTLGGGEPLLHMDFWEAFRPLCPTGWTFWAETALNVEPDIIPRATQIFRHFIVDIKSVNPDIYTAYTGGSGQRALDNLMALKSLVGQENITVRVPLIPGYADAQSQAENVQAVQDLGFTRIDAFVYRTNMRKHS